MHHIHAGGIHPIMTLLISSSHPSPPTSSLPLLYCQTKTQNSQDRTTSPPLSLPLHIFLNSMFLHSTINKLLNPKTNMFLKNLFVFSLLKFSIKVQFDRTKSEYIVKPSILNWIPYFENRPPFLFINWSSILNTE